MTQRTNAAKKNQNLDHARKQMPETSAQPTYEGLDAEIRSLQQTIGNQAVGQLLESDAASDGVPSSVQNVVNSGGQPLDPVTRAQMESQFERDFSQVRIHADSTGAESAEAVSANAYTVGRDVVFGAGRYAPETPSGKQLLAHELTHVVQQNTAAINRPLSINSHSQSEYEANRAATSVAQGGAAQVTGTSGVAVQRQEAASGNWLTRRAQQVVEATRSNLAEAEKAVRDKAGDLKEAASAKMEMIKQEAAAVKAVVITGVGELQEKGSQAVAKLDQAKQAAVDLKDRATKSIVKTATQAGKQIKQRAGEKVMETLGTVKGVLLEGATMLDTVLWLKMKIDQLEDMAVEAALPILLKQLRTQGIKVPYSDEQIIAFYKKIYGSENIQKQYEKLGVMKKNPNTGVVEFNLASGLSDLTDEQAAKLQKGMGGNEDRGLVFTSYELGELEGSVGTQVGLAYVGAEEVQIGLKALGAIGAVKAVLEDMKRDNWENNLEFWLKVFNVVLSMIGLYGGAWGKKAIQIILKAGTFVGLISPLRQLYSDWQHPKPEASEEKQKLTLAKDWTAVVKAGQAVVMALAHSQPGKAPEEGSSPGTSAPAEPSSAPTEPASAPAETTSATQAKPAVPTTEPVSAPQPASAMPITEPVSAPQVKPVTAEQPIPPALQGPLPPFKRLAAVGKPANKSPQSALKKIMLPDEHLPAGNDNGSAPSASPAETPAPQTLASEPSTQATGKLLDLNPRLKRAASKSGPDSEPNTQSVPVESEVVLQDAMGSGLTRSSQAGDSPNGRPLRIVASNEGNQNGGGSKPPVVETPARPPAEHSAGGVGSRGGTRRRSLRAVPDETPTPASESPTGGAALASSEGTAPTKSTKTPNVKGKNKANAARKRSAKEAGLSEEAYSRGEDILSIFAEGQRKATRSDREADIKSQPEIGDVAKPGGGRVPEKFDVGNFAHDYAEDLVPKLPPNLTKEFTIKLPDGGKKRLDRVDFENGVIYEIKSNRRSQVAAGKKQAQLYEHYMNEHHPLPDGQLWTSKVVTYNRQAVRRVLRQIGWLPPRK